VLEALILGIIQGLTEFLPISSSGHLVLFDNLFKLISNGHFDSSLAERLDFIVAVHLGTLVAVFIYFWRDIWAIIKALPAFFRPRSWKSEIELEPFRLALGVLLVTIVTVIVALPLKRAGFLKAAFESLGGVGVAFIVVGTFLFFTRFSLAKTIKTSVLGIVVGIAQSVALLPGISRSGATIGTALLLGAEREFAAKLSFMAAIPAIIGAAILEFSANSVSNLNFAVLAVGFFSSFVSGLFALKILLKIIKHGQLYRFAYYLWIVGAFTVILAIAR